MVSSGNRWSFVDRYRIPNGSSMLYNKEIRMSENASEIKCIHDRAGSQAKSGGVCRPGVSCPHHASAASVSRKSLTAKTVPTLRSKTMPSLSAKSTRQDPCQVEKIFWWGQLSPGVSQSVRGQENIMLTCAVTMREHYIKTSIPASELGLPSMEIDSRPIKYNNNNRLDTIYSSVSHNYRRTLSKWT